jgi:hypothetical protein
MDDQRHAHGLEVAAGEFRAVCGRGGRESGAVHAREIDAGLLEDRALFQYAGAAATTARTVPGILAERMAIEICECGADTLLKIEQILLDEAGVEIRHGVSGCGNH